VILAWSGIQNQSITNTLKPIIGGKAPTPGPAGPSGTIVSGNTESGGAAGEINATTPGSGSAAANAALGRLMATGHGWSTGAQWTALNNVAMRESGWNANAINPSGAYGIAQALGHAGPGEGGTVSSTAYGGYGVSTATAKAANSGSATAQIAWMLAYIQQTYGTPEGAWNSELSRGFY
jgi:hypothetical protein